MENISKRLLEAGEFYASGYTEDCDRSRFYRTAKAMLRYREHCSLPKYNGELLYPNGKCIIDKMFVYPEYAFTHHFDYESYDEYDRELAEYCQNNIPMWHTVREEPQNGPIYGGVYTHASVNYFRIMNEGLDSYRERILKCEDKDFREGCLLVLEGIEIYRRRCIEYLRSVSADEKLIASLEKIPFKKADTLYEALIGWNFIYYIDLCDNIGSFDRELDHWYNGEDVVDVLRNFYRNVDANDGWSLRVGPEIYPITYQILEASRGIRRPSVELCIDGDVPEDIRLLSSDLIKSGSSNPCFYNYPIYQKALHERFPNIPQCDLDKFAGGGCTETMLTGISRVGSIDGSVNTAYVFCEYMNECLAEKDTFEDFYEGLIERITKYANMLFESINDSYKYASEYMPNPVRTVLIDDCIDNGKDYNAGGARWNWSTVNFSGTVNVIESLLAIREIIYEKKEMTAKEFLERLNAEEEFFYKRLKKCLHYGVNDKCADSLATDFLKRVYSTTDGKKSYFGDGFVSSSIQFITYVRRGENVGPTPDGRKKGEPLCDSLAPIFGNDTKSVTSTLGSVSSLDLKLALGTPVVNLRLSKKYSDEMLFPLIRGFFENGGMMLQINCISREELEDAMVNPDKHRNLLVRTGGYTEYFVNLSPKEQRTIIARTEYDE